MEENPYATPKAQVQDGDDPASLDIRLQNENREISIRLIGCAFLLLSLIAISKFDLPPDFKNKKAEVQWYFYNSTAAAFLITIVVPGYGLVTLRKWARIGAVIWVLIFAFRFPIGTIIAVYYLYLLLSPTTSFVLSPTYRKIITKTQNYRLRFNKSHWLVLAPHFSIFAFIIYFFLIK